MPQKTEINSFTGLRGIAAVYVVIFHYSIGFKNSNPITTFLSHGYLAVDLFFVLSGFVMALNYSYMFRSGISLASYFTFLGRRIARVYPLYFVATLCGFFLVIIGWGEKLSRSPWINLLSNVFMFQAWGFGGSLDGPGWSISTEWAAYLLFPILLLPTMFCKSVVANISLAVCVACVALLCILPPAITGNTAPMAPLHLYRYHHGFPVYRCLSEFSIGMLAFRFSSSSIGKNFGKKAWPIFVLCGVCVLLLTIPRSDFVFVLTLPLLLVALSTGEHVPQKILSSAPFMLAGALSYSIYLIHDLLGGVLRWVNGQVTARGLNHAQTYSASVGIILTFGLAWMAYKLIETPGRTWLRKVFEGNSRHKIEKVPSIEIGMP